MRLLIAIFASLFITAAQAQTPIVQSGHVTYGHAAYFLTNGVAADAGAAAYGFLTSLGVTAQGPGICQNSAAITGPYYQICLGVTTSGGPQLSVQNYGGAAAKNLVFLINGTPYTFPFSTGGNVVGPNSSTVNDAACWNNTTGTLLSDCGSPIRTVAPGVQYYIAGGESAFTGAISGTTLTVSSVLAGTLAVGETVNGAGISVPTTVTAFGTGSGGTGTYTVSASQSVSSESMTTATGSDAYDCLAPSYASGNDGPCATINHAYYNLLNTVDLRGIAGTLNAACGDYYESDSFDNGPIGSHYLAFVGAGSDCTNWHNATTFSGPVFFTDKGWATMQGFFLDGSTNDATVDFSAAQDVVVDFDGDMKFAPVELGVQIVLGVSTAINCGGTIYFAAGTSGALVDAANPGAFFNCGNGNTFDMLGTIDYTSAVAAASNNAVVVVPQESDWTGSTSDVTGLKWETGTGGHIFTGPANQILDTAIPGTIGGHNNSPVYIGRQAIVGPLSSSNYIPDYGTNEIIANCVAAGGGGGAAAATSIAQAAVGSGGGAGAPIVEPIFASQINAVGQSWDSVGVTIGAAGAGGVSGTSQPTAGGQLCFGSCAQTASVTASVTSVAGASFTASISTSGGIPVMTVSAIGSGTLAKYQTIAGTNVPFGLYIVAQLTGTPGSTGTYELISQPSWAPPIDVGSESMTSAFTQLNVTAVGSGTVAVGAMLLLGGIYYQAAILAFGTGSGGTGSYYLIPAVPVTGSGTVTLYTNPFVLLLGGSAGTNGTAAASGAFAGGAGGTSASGFVGGTGQPAYWNDVSPVQAPAGGAVWPFSPGGVAQVTTTAIGGATAAGYGGGGGGAANAFGQGSTQNGGAGAPGACLIDEFGYLLNRDLLPFANDNAPLYLHKVG